MTDYRYTQRDLDGALRGLNLAAGLSAEEADAPLWSVVDGTNRAMVGRYSLDCAYGGIRVVQTVSASGATRSLSTGSYGTKRQAYATITAYKEGLYAGMAQSRHSIAALRIAAASESRS